MEVKILKQTTAMDWNLIDVLFMIRVSFAFISFKQRIKWLLAKDLHTTPNYLLLGDVEADDWMDDMIQMLEKVKRPKHRELAKKQIALLAEIGDY